MRTCEGKLILLYFRQGLADGYVRQGAQRKKKRGWDEMKSTEVVYGGINNQIAFTRFGFGSLPIGWYRRYVQQEDAVALVQSAYQNGVRLFDTSPLYGALRAEWILGKAPIKSDALRQTHAIIIFCFIPKLLPFLLLLVASNLLYYTLSSN